MLVPISEMGKSLDVFEKHYGIYPLWICPYRAYDYGAANGEAHRSFLRKPKADTEDLKTGEKYEMYVDLGAYGIPRSVLQKEPFDAIARGRDVEDFVQSVRGFQMLYADTYLTKQEFYHMFDHTHYFKMKAKYDKIDAFPEIFGKVSKNAQAGKDTKKSK